MSGSISNRQLLYYGALVIALIAAALVLRTYSAPKQAQAAQGPRQVRWLLSHQPTAVFARATKVFADELSKDSGGDLTLQVVMPQDIGQQSGDVPNSKVFQLLDSGQVQLATTYTVALGQEDPALWSLNLPFLFTSYAGTPAVLDGPVGQSILETIGQKTSAQGLAFTMSGGFRIIASKDKAIRGPEDLRGLHIATSGGPVAEATLKALGAIPVTADLESGSAPFDPDTIDGVETTYSRLSAAVGSDTQYTRYINETNHSMFLTAILAGDNFYQSLSAKDRAALRAAALAAAAIEREDSEALGATTKQALEARGSNIITMSPEKISAMKSVTQPVYAQFAPLVGEELTQKLSAPGQ